VNRHSALHFATKIWKTLHDWVERSKWVLKCLVQQNVTLPKGAVSFQLKTVICDLWENAKSYDLAICRDNYVYNNQIQNNCLIKTSHRCVTIG
jgi:hypothetical protein